ncbi:hypothetical protein [Pseudomonas protegens]|uniref:hypothetical protein n=1 Tax=Pseudomonas protegens TaxID=380021 RepID=UPI0022829009|nr:hypothetical protein [Pseudomonas protegens]MCY7264349.1 hypothetical protein [Pseudomonas protegens]
MNNRARFNYYSGQVVEVYVPDSIAMAGFRFAGAYKKSGAPSFLSDANGPLKVSLISNLGVESTAHANNWYGLFACANAGDASAKYKLMPFLRIGSIAGSVASFTYGGEGPSAHVVTTTSYAWADDSLRGADCLVINESGRFSARVTTITGNRTSTVTLADPGGIGAFDFLLPAPPGFEHYVYLGSFYRDTAEVRNIADTGAVVGSYGVQVQDPNFPLSGPIAQTIPGSPGIGARINFGGYISPLATAVTFENGEKLNTASLGLFAINFSHDGSNHVVGRHLLCKESSPVYYRAQTITMPFSIGQFSYAWTGGNLQTDRTGTIQIYGSIEL